MFKRKIILSLILISVPFYSLSGQSIKFSITEAIISIDNETNIDRTRELREESIGSEIIQHFYPNTDIVELEIDYAILLYLFPNRVVDDLFNEHIIQLNRTSNSNYSRNFSPEGEPVVFRVELDLNSLFGYLMGGTLKVLYDINDESDYNTATTIIEFDRI